MRKEKFEPTDNLIVLALATNAANQAGQEICSSGVALSGENPMDVKASGRPMCENCVYGVRSCPRPRAEKVAFQEVEIKATKTLKRG